MRAIVFFLLATTILYPSEDPVITEVRSLYLSSPKDKENCEKLLEILEDIESDDNPLFYGYKGGATMIMAKHIFNPFKRLSYFKKGKKMLNKAILADPHNAELRLLRFGVQTNAPAFLAYRGEIEEDKKLLLNSLPRIKDRALKKYMKEYLENSDHVTQREKEQLSSL